MHFKPTYFGRWSPESFIQKQKDKQKRMETCIRFRDFEVLHDYFEVTLK